MAAPSRWDEIDDLELIGLGDRPAAACSMQESEKGSGRTERRPDSERAKMGNALETPLGSRIVRLSNLTASATQSRRTPNAFSSVTELTQSEPRTEAFRQDRHLFDGSVIRGQNAEIRCSIAVHVGQRHVWCFPRVCDTEIGFSAHHFAISAQGRHYPGVVSGPPFYLCHPITRALDVALPPPNSISG
ncbi:hypothetical protein QR685DRAFT_571834 [Neurospora intermedia]|uniref:Uncharacterized protein n=1 Tax=Neurospora intermedia TaxID=5142 RepID=A0ABR3DDW3_NEUIN